MKEDKFDDIIRNKLADINLQDGIDAWSLFEKKMQADQDLNTLTEDIEFDHTVNQKVKQHKTAFQIAHWDILKTQLQTIENRISTVWLTKCLEVCAIFLISFTFIRVSHMMEYKGGTNTNIIIASNNETPNILKDQVNESFYGENENGPNVGEVNSTREKLNAKTLLSSGVSSNNNQTNENIGLSNNEVTFLALDTQNKTDQPIRLIPNSIKPIAMASKVPVLQLHQIVDTKDIGTVPLLENQIDVVASEMAQSFPMTIAPELIKAKKYISVYKSADVNLINTPFDKLYSLASYNKEALNDSYGINFSTKKNNLEVEAGVGLAYRTYQPEYVTEAYGQFGEHYFEKSLKEISFDIINIPLNIKYHFVNSTHWSAYLMVGATFNMIANADYEISEILKDGRPENRFAPDQARLDEKSFIKGILNSGSLSENYFATVGFGFGIEKTLFSNTSLYLQPNYQRHMFSHDIGIGPNKDKIHSASLQIGVKTSLN